MPLEAWNSVRRAKEAQAFKQRPLPSQVTQVEGHAWHSDFLLGKNPTKGQVGEQKLSMSGAVYRYELEVEHLLA